MPVYVTDAIRNIALVGHAGAGKTTLIEALLHRAGVIGAAGSVERGDTVSDHDPLEQKHLHSLTSAVVSLDHEEAHITLIDTPGMPEFVGLALAALPAVETVGVVINAQAGIETGTRQLMAAAAERRLCRFIVINRIDGEGADPATLLQGVQETFGTECLPINLPAGGGTDVADCFFEPGGNPDFSSVEEAHTALVDQTVEVDEELMAVYLEQGEVSPEQLHDPFEEALREGHLVPVCFTSAANGAGVDALLRIMARLMPSPAEGNPPAFVGGEGEDAEPVTVTPDPSSHVLAHVFKVSFDPFVGKLSFLRVHQGTITKDSQLFIGDARKAFKVGHLFAVQGKKHEEVSQGIPGDIRALAKVEETFLGAVLHDSHDEDHIRMLPMQFPMPMAGLAVKPASRGDEQKVNEVLQRLSQEDPCIAVEHNASANETVLRALGDLHLRIALERMEQQYNLHVETGEPSIPYRETIRKKAEGHCRHKKQTGGAGQFGEVYLRVEPLSRGSGFEFVNQIVGGVIPGQFIPAVEKGIRQVLEGGAVAGYPLQDVRVVLYDGKHHPVDSKEVAFSSAGRKAFIDAVRKANPVVLEPVMSVEIIVPEGAMGDVTGDLSSRRGRVSSTDMRDGGMVCISGQVPLGEMRDLPSRLKSISGGAGSFTSQFAGYEPAPANLQQELMSAFKQTDED